MHNNGYLIMPKLQIPLLQYPIICTRLAWPLNYENIFLFYLYLYFLIISFQFFLAFLALYAYVLLFHEIPFRHLRLRPADRLDPEPDGQGQHPLRQRLQPQGVPEDGGGLRVEAGPGGLPRRGSDRDRWEIKGGKIGSIHEFNLQGPEFVGFQRLWKQLHPISDGFNNKNNNSSLFSLY